MSIEKNKLLVRRFIEEVVNTGNVDQLEEIVSPDYTEVHSGTRHRIGIDGAKEHILGVRHTYPDLSLEIEQQIAEGEWVATSYTARGTFQNSWMGMKPTGEAVEYTGVNINRVINGKIVEHGGAANLLLTLLEIGAVQVVDGKE